jgi:hypothetical protein
MKDKIANVIYDFYSNKKSNEECTNELYSIFESQLKEERKAVKWVIDCLPCSTIDYMYENSEDTKALQKAVKELIRISNLKP